MGKLADDGSSVAKVTSQIKYMLLTHTCTFYILGSQMATVPQRMPLLHADAVLLDIDRTLVNSQADCEVFCEALHELVAEQRGTDIAEALRIVNCVFDPAEQDPLPYLDRLGITRGAYHSRVAQRLRSSISPYPDAGRFIEYLRQLDVKVYPATTNGPTAIVAKMACAGFGDVGGNSCFADLFGGSTVCPTGKSGPAFYLAILNRIGVSADRVVMIGDDPQRDIVDARAAGIRQTILIDREGTASSMPLQPPVLSVRSLVEIIPILHSCSNR